MQNQQTHVEENVDDLLKKLEGKGKKVKIIDDDAEEEQIEAKQLNIEENEEYKTMKARM